MNKYLRQDLRDFHPYHSPIKPYEIKMDANESPFPHHPDFEAFSKNYTKDYRAVTRYPDTDALRLRQAIAKSYKQSSDNVVCGVGSDQVIDMIIRAFINPGDKVIMPSPSFDMYYLSTMLNHGQPVQVPLDHDFEYDLDLFIDKIKEEQASLVFLCTPNNPTGCVLSRKEVIRVIESCQVPIVVDEAYADFTGITVSDLINDYDNLIVLRTFSKAFGLAGLRTGYALACKELIDCIYITKPPYNLSSFSQEASIFVLEHQDFYMEQVAKITSYRQSLSLRLSKLTFVEKVYPSGTNFVLVKVSKEGIAKMLEEQLILIRDYGPSGPLASCVRITLGTEKENDKLMATLESFA